MILPFRRLMASACLAGLASVSCAAETSQTLFHSSATDSITVMRDPLSGAAMVQKVAVDYHELSYILPDQRSLIARETVKTGYSYAAEGLSGEATVDLFFQKPDESYPSQPDQTVVVKEASQVKFNNDHWSAKITGCCDTEPLTQLFAYGENKPFLYANSQYAQVQLPATNVNRYVGLVLRSSIILDELEPAIFGDDKKAVAAVLYGGPGQPMQKKFFYPKRGVDQMDIPYHTNTVVLKSPSSEDDHNGYNEDKNISSVLVLWSQEKTVDNVTTGTMSGFEITAKFVATSDVSDVITIPVENDRLGAPEVSGPALTANPDESDGFSWPDYSESAETQEPAALDEPAASSE